MAQEHINWTARIKAGVDVNFYTHFPPDITFKIEENGSVHRIDAHKVLMGLASLVFNRMFVMDTKDKDAKEILIKETTPQAFQIMKDGIYNTKLIKDSLNGKSVTEVFSVLDLVTRYEIPELQISVREYLAKFPLTDDNVLDVAEDAINYTETFADEAQELLMTCARFLKPKLNDAQAVFRYVADNMDRGEVVLKLQVLMKEEASLPCTNCQQETCLDGQVVLYSQARVGLVVTNNIGHFGAVNFGTARIISVNPNGWAINGSASVILEKIKNGESSVHFNTNPYPLRSSTSNKNYFLFSCK